MYKNPAQQLIMPREFFLPFGGKLNPNNQCCQLASIIDWSVVEEAYPARLALGSLVIQNRKVLSDRDSVSKITQNQYMQYFIGLQAFTEEAPFDASLMVHFRKRFNLELINKINEMIVNPKNDDCGSQPPDSGETTEAVKADSSSNEDQII